MLTEWELERLQNSLGRFVMKLNSEVEITAEEFAQKMGGAVEFVEYIEKETKEDEN